MSKILIHCLVFSPDGVSTAYLYNDIALRFCEKGYEVAVLTTTPHYNVLPDELKKQPLFPRLGGLYFVSSYKGITVKHIPQKKYKSAVLRMIGFVHWHLISFVLGLCEKNIDIILSPSPPLTIGLVNILIGKIKGCKVIYNVQEIYPDLLIEQGNLHSKVIIHTLRRIEKFIYDHSDKTTTIDSVFYHTIKDRFNVKSKLMVIPNFVDTSIYYPMPENSIDVDRSNFPETTALKLMYAGNIGHAQDWALLVEIARKLKDDNVEFFVIGEGVMKDYIVNEMDTNHLSKIHIIPYQPRESIPSLIAYADLQFIFMSSRTEGHGFPSKVYTIMACKKPLLVCSGPHTPIMEFLKDKGCAYIVEEHDFKKKINRMVNILKSIDKKQLQLMGKKGSEYIDLHYTKETVTEMYVNLAETLLK